MPGKTQSLPSRRTTGCGSVSTRARDEKGTDHPEVRCDEEDLSGVREEGHAPERGVLLLVLRGGGGAEADVLLHAGERFWVVAEWLVESFRERGVRDICGA